MEITPLFLFPVCQRTCKPSAMTNHTCMNLRIAEAQPLFCKERYIVSGGSADCLCLYVFLCTDGPEKESRFSFVAFGQQEKSGIMGFGRWEGCGHCYHNLMSTPLSFLQSKRSYSLFSNDTQKPSVSSAVTFDGVIISCLPAICLFACVM